MEKPVVKLIGADGNAFAILGQCRAVANKEGWTKEQVEVFTQKATSGDYDNLLRVVMEYFDVK
jgi:hypothetical protein